MQRALGAAALLLFGPAFAACTHPAVPVPSHGAGMEAVPWEVPAGEAGAMNAEPPPADSSDPRWGGHIGSGT